MNTVFFSLLLVLNYFVNFSFGYYGDPKNGGMYITPAIGNAIVSIGDNIYSLGGEYLHIGEQVRLAGNDTIFNFTSDGTLQVYSFETRNADSLFCNVCQGYVLPDNKTVAVIGFRIDDPSTNDTEGLPRKAVGLGFFDSGNKVWLPTDTLLNTSLLPERRRYFASAISPQGDALYLIGGVSIYDTTNAPVSIIRYDLLNQASIVDLGIEHPSLNLTLLGASANMLPNGVVVLAFGDYGNRILYNSSQVLLFDTNINEIRIQPINGIAPIPRTQASSILGPDKTTIYYFGGQDAENSINLYAGIVYNDVVILDTNTWSWIPLDITGVAPAPTIYHGMAVFSQNKNFISTGESFDFYSESISVLRNVPVLGESIESSNLQWFTNYDVFHNYDDNKGLSSGVIAGITIGVLLFISITFTLLWIYVPSTKVLTKYIWKYLIPNARLGEPLWAETIRLIVRFILLIFFLSFVVYVICRSIDSPIVPQYSTKVTNKVLIPDIRFCFNGFNETNFLPYVSCIFTNGTSCYDKIERLNGKKHTPSYKDIMGNVSCSMFSPGPDFYIVSSSHDYTATSGIKLRLSFFAEPLEFGNLDLGVIFIDFYPPGYNPNLRAQGIDNVPKMSGDDYLRWKSEEQLSDSMDTILLRQGVISTVSYTLTTVQKLRKDDGWNYIGFSSSYDDSMEVKASYKDSPQSTVNMPAVDDYERGYISQLVVQPDAFTLTTNKEQKVFTLLNAFAQIGGILGLFISIQAILFGFRPQSPWGIVHRWSFGSLQAELTDKLASSFNEMGKPVPLFDPVSNRLNSMNQNQLGSSSSSNNNNTYITGDNLDIQDSWESHIENRLHLMEHVLKNYYLDDEIFRSLGESVNSHREKIRRANPNEDQNKDNCFVAQKDIIKENDINNDINAVTNVISRSSSLLSRSISTQEKRSDDFNSNTRLISFEEEYK